MSVIEISSNETLASTNGGMAVLDPVMIDTSIESSDILPFRDTCCKERPNFTCSD